MDRFLGDIVIVQGLTMPMMLESTGHFLAAESCNLIIGLRSVIPFLTKVKKPSTCGPRLFVRLLTLVGILDRIWMRLRFLNNKIILPGTDLYNSYIIARTVRAF